MERLDKILVSQNYGSRKEVHEIIRAGRVSVNASIIKDSAHKINVETEQIKLDGKEVSFKRYLYIMMNKPRDILSATKDRSQKTVLDILPKEFSRKGLFPAGRLDIDTEGLLIITDDGDFAHKILSPKKHIYKTYQAILDKDITNEDIRLFNDGLILHEMTCLPASLKSLDKKEIWEKEFEDKYIVEVKIREGKFHQVKKMFISRGKTILALRRIKIGELQLDPFLSLGDSRELTQKEQNYVLKVTGL